MRAISLPAPRHAQDQGVQHAWSEPLAVGDMRLIRVHIPAGAEFSLASSPFHRVMLGLAGTATVVGPPANTRLRLSPVTAVHVDPGEACVLEGVEEVTGLLIEGPDVTDGGLSNDEEPLLEPEAYQWREGDWEDLLLSIHQKKCTPFIGAGACAGFLPTAQELVTEWIRSDGFPFSDGRSLDRVAQYVATRKNSPLLPKLRVVQKFHELMNVSKPDLSDPHQPLRTLAWLKQPIYLTTNYDSYLVEAITKEIGRAPQIAWCDWYKPVSERRRYKGLAPSPEFPLVYHLHGTYTEAKSMVLTEDDYLDFLTEIVEDKHLIPAAVGGAFGNSMFLFVGYSLNDLNFRILFKKLAMYQEANTFSHVAVQLEPGGERETRSRRLAQLRYLNQRYKSLKVRVFWGTASAFTHELGKRLGRV